MEQANAFRRILPCVLWATLCVLPHVAADATPQEAAHDILSAAGLQGGLIVHVGCGDGTLTAALRASDSFAVHGLDADAANVAKARRHVQSLGLYGPVAIDRLAGTALPYVENMVNLLVSEDLGGVPAEEVMRVLAPNGVAYVKADGRWTKTVKPRPADIDDWTHYLYDASNNAVSKDTQVGPPRHLQWIDGPRYSRHHDHMSCISAMVEAGDRVFSIFDYSSPQSIELPSDWYLVARDAFNGTQLWKRPIDDWYTQMFRLKSGPTLLTRRLVAAADRVYVTLGLAAPATALDAATGRTLLTYEGSAGTEEILLRDGVLLLVINDKPFRQPADPKNYSYAWPQGPRRIAAYEAATGKPLWDSPQPTVLPMTLCADERRVIFHDGKNVVCLDRATGKETWRSELMEWRHPLPTSFVPTLVLYRDVVLYSGGGNATNVSDFSTEGNIIHGISATDGKTLWGEPHPPSGHRTAQDTLVVGGVVWTPTIAKTGDSGEMIGRDPLTGEVKSRFLPDVTTYWFHHRCYRSKATEKYILTSRTGIEFIDPVAKHWTINHWTRGGCLYGIMPANGMIYNPPHPCACYLEAKTYGFNALAPATPSRELPADIGQEGRLERGPAFDQIAENAGEADGQADWPTLRHDTRRSGSTAAAVPTDVKAAWKVQLGGRLSAPVVAAGKLYVAQVDLHTLHALDAATGAKAWSFVAGGRIDSPPTIWKGRVLFGSADGYVYCLRAADGAMAWRFRAAPIDRRLCADGQIESVWPVHGSVLVQDGALWCVAGRWRFLDGGLRLLKLDPRTGGVLVEKVLNDRDEEGKDLQEHLKGLDMPVALADVLVGDGQWIYMKSQRFDANGVPQATPTPMGNFQNQEGPYQHLFCPTGLLDDIWWHRSYWVYGQVWKSGAGGYYLAGRAAPTGRPLVFDDASVYAFCRKPDLFRWTTPMEYRLYASAAKPELERNAPPGAGGGRQPARRPASRANVASPPNLRILTLWSDDLPILVRAMVKADDTIFLAGPPDVVDEQQALRTFANPATQAKLARQAQALLGKEGMNLWAVSTADGAKLAEWHLDSVPVFDGLIAAGGRLYLTDCQGQVVCMAK